MAPAAIAPLIAIGALLLVALAVRLQRRHQGRLVGTVPHHDSEAGVDILYFTGVACTICHVAQRPALARLVAGRADITVREVDVADEPDLARRYRVMTLPTTIVFDAARRVAAVNAGFTTESVLGAQVDGARQRTAQVSVA